MASRVRQIETHLIRASKANPRKDFDVEALNELAASIREVGIIQPIVVVQRGQRFQIVAGERRWRAAKLVGLTKIPAIVRDLSRQEIAKLSLIENFHRRDLNPVEEAQAIEELIRVLKVGVNEVSEMLGKSDGYVYTRRRLLELPSEILREIEEGRLPVATAQHLTRLSNKHEIRELGLAAVRGQLTAYQVECAVRDRLKSRTDRERSKAREEIYNKKLRLLREETGKEVVAYNEFDSSAHQRVWNLRFDQCRKCPMKGILLTRDMREEELCVVSSCYQKLENRERNEKIAKQTESRSAIRSELERILHRDEVEPLHLRLLAFAMLDAMGPVADEWRKSNGMSVSTQLDGHGAIWKWLSKRDIDALVTASVELSVLYLSSVAEVGQIPKAMVEDLGRQFHLDTQLLHGHLNGNGKHNGSRQKGDLNETRRKPASRSAQAS